MPQPVGASRPYHSGLRPESVIDAAVELTAEGGLWSWSLRDLAKTLHVTPSVVYHHVGGRDLLCRNVAERAVQEIPHPDPAMEWRAWFTAYLYAARPVLLNYPGVAKWLVLHGPAFPAAVPVVDAGVATLRRAGFGDDTAYVYSSLFNTAMMTLTISDERRRHEDDGHRDHQAMMDEFAAVANDSPGLGVLIDGIVAPFTAGQEAGNCATLHYFSVTMEALMDGFEFRLGRRADEPRTQPFPVDLSDRGHR